MTITFVIPVLNERESLVDLMAAIAEHAAPYDFNCIAVDDGSCDGSLGTLLDLAGEYEWLTAVSREGPQGKSPALATGFALAQGDLIITMDSDLQDDPKEIPRFVAKIDEGFDVVCGWKVKRRDPWHKVVPSYVYNAVVSRLFGLAIHDVNCGFRALHREVVESIHLHSELHRLIPVLAHQLGYRVGEIAVDHHPRRHGHSKFGCERFYRGARDVFGLYFGSLSGGRK